MSADLALFRDFIVTNFSFLLSATYRCARPIPLQTETAKNAIHCHLLNHISTLLCDTLLYCTVMYIMCNVVHWCVALFNKQGVSGASTTPIRFQSSVLAFENNLTNCKITWVGERQVTAILHATQINFVRQSVGNE